MLWNCFWVLPLFKFISHSKIKLIVEVLGLLAYGYLSYSWHFNHASHGVQFNFSLASEELESFDVNHIVEQPIKYKNRDAEGDELRQVLLTGLIAQMFSWRYQIWLCRASETRPNDYQLTADWFLLYSYRSFCRINFWLQSAHIYSFFSSVCFISVFSLPFFPYDIHMLPGELAMYSHALVNSLVSLNSRL